MTFTGGIPTTGQSLGNSRSQVAGNFTNYNNVVSQDHVAPNATGEGKHKKSTYVDQASDQATIANEMAEYVKAVAGVSELFLRRENNGTVIQMSRGDPIVASSGSTFLPGGVILKWGALAGVVNNQAITFVTAFPNNCWVVVPGGGVASSTVQPNINFDQATLTTAGFTTKIIGTTPINYYYIAIGN